LLLADAGRGSVGGTSSRRGFASDIDFLRMEPKPFRRDKTEGTNNYIKQRNAFIFARNPIGATYNQLPAMFTRTFHNSPLKKPTFNIRNRLDGIDRRWLNVACSDSL
jgi:hypothetical protein